MPKPKHPPNRPHSTVILSDEEKAIQEAGAKEKAKAAVHPKDKGGRPTAFSQDVANAICERIADGESLRAICDDQAMPAKSSVFLWLSADATFSDQYARAREAQADSLADDLLPIADDGLNDWMERRGEDNAGWVENGEALRRSQIRIDARKWLASKLAPKKYGDKLQQEISGKDGAPLIPVVNVTLAGAGPTQS